MSNETKEQIKDTRTLREVLDGVLKTAEKIRDTFKEQTDAAKTVESVISAQEKVVKDTKKSIKDYTDVIVQAIKDEDMDANVEATLAKDVARDRLQLDEKRLESIN